jgi:hypothetical protein
MLFNGLVGGAALRKMVFKVWTIERLDEEGSGSRSAKEGVSSMQWTDQWRIVGQQVGLIVVQRRAAKLFNLCW